MPIIRHTPLKQNIRVWYDYLKTAIRHKYKINKDYYSAWHLPQVKKLTFDKWWISHKHLFDKNPHSILNKVTPVLW